MRYHVHMKMRQLRLVFFLCSVCGQMKSVPIAWLKKVKKPTCSRKCNGVLRGQEWAKHGHKGRAAWSQETERRFSERMTGENNPNWGGRSVTGDGYVMVLNRNHPRANAKGYVYEHIVVMEQKIGRRLRRGEVIHHIDGNQSNNDPDNLRLHRSQELHLKKEHPRHFAIAAKDR